MSFNVVLTIAARFFIYVCAIPPFLTSALLLFTSQIRVANGTIAESHYWSEARPAIVCLAISLVAALISIALSLNRSN